MRKEDVHILTYPLSSRNLDVFTFPVLYQCRSFAAVISVDVSPIHPHCWFIAL